MIGLSSARRMHAGSPTSQFILSPSASFCFPGGAPVMLCGPETGEYAELASRISDVRVLREFTHPDEDYPFTTIQTLAEIVSEVISDWGSIRKIGLAGRGLISAGLLASFEASLPSAEWKDVENAICDIRARKSHAEIAVIRYGYQIAEAGLMAAVDAICVGATEREVAAEAECAMRRMGAEGTGIDTIVASGPNSRPILARSTFRIIQPDELVLLTVAPRYEGYHAAIGRPVLVGDPGGDPPCSGSGLQGPGGLLQCDAARHRRARCGGNWARRCAGRRVGIILPLLRRAQRWRHRI